MNSKCNLSVPLLLFRQLRSTILNNTILDKWQIILCYYCIIISRYVDISIDIIMTRYVDDRLCNNYT